MALFDSYLMVDWSAASAPVTGANSIWWAMLDGDDVLTGNPATRQAAMAEIETLIRAKVQAGHRVLVGFDFAFGYPCGSSDAFGLDGGWRGLWTFLHDAIEDDTRNRNNRFDVAAGLNARLDAPGPFWAALPKATQARVPRQKAYAYGEDGAPNEVRTVERLARNRGIRPFPVWQLSGPGTVGGQVLTGLHWLEKLRRSLGEQAAVWPLETGLTTPRAPVVIAEIYPSLFHVDADPGDVLDAAQVRTVVQTLAALDRQDELAMLFQGPQGLSDQERAAIVTEEAWILGVGSNLGRQVAPRLRYERDPASIYRQSFDTVRAEARLDHLPENLRNVAIRLVHACGMTDVTARLAWSEDVADAASKALQAGAPVICDCEAVASMIVRNRLPADNEVICTLNDPRTRTRAREIGNTRSAAAVEFWEDHLEGAIVAIGNAPTALFHLLEQIDAGAPLPAAILGFPVGFVGAAESKAELATRPRGVAFLTLRGRRGGSAMAAAAVNALAAGLETPA